MAAVESAIFVRSMLIRLGNVEVSVREDGSLLITVSGVQNGRLELGRAESEVLAGIIRMISRG